MCLCAIKVSLPYGPNDRYWDKEDAVRRQKRSCCASLLVYCERPLETPAASWCAPPDRKHLPLPSLLVPPPTRDAMASSSSSRAHVYRFISFLGFLDRDNAAYISCDSTRRRELRARRTVCVTTNRILGHLFRRDGSPSCLWLCGTVSWLY